MISNLFFVTIKILIIILILISLISIFFYFKNINKNRVLNKSTLKSIFKNKFSLLIIVFFYGISFGLVGGLSSYSQAGKKQINNMVIDHKSHLGDVKTFTEVGYDNEIFEFITSFSPSSTISDKQDFIDELNNFYTSGSSFEFWLEYSKYFGQSIDDFISLMVYEKTFEKFNSIIDNEQELSTLTNQNDIDLYNNLTNNSKSKFKFVYNVETYFTYKDSINFENDITFQFVGFNPWGEQNELNDGYIFDQENNSSEKRDVDFRWRNSQYGEYVINEPVISDYDQSLSSERDLYDILSSDDSSVYGDGSKNNPYKIIVQQEIFDNNNLDYGETIKIGTGTWVQIIASGWYPDIIYPVFSVNSVITDLNKQSWVLINKNAFFDHPEIQAKFRFLYGYTDIYDEVKTFDQFIDNKSNINSLLNDRTNELNHFFKNRFPNSIIPENGNISNAETLESTRVFLGMLQISNNQQMAIIFMYVFLIIVTIVLFMLIQKRVKDSSKQLGTLKALGVKNSSIASSYIIFPIVIISLGLISSLIFLFPIQFVFSSQIKLFYSFPLQGLSFDFFTFILIYLLPLLLFSSLSYLISLFILRKPTLELLTNKAKDKPNLLVRTSGKLIPKNASFNFSYTFKGVFRAFGKSMLLFFSMLISIFLTSLSLSTATMSKSVSSSINETIKYADYSMGLFDQEKNYEIKYEDNFSNNEPIYSYETNSEKINFVDLSDLTSSVNVDDQYQNVGRTILNSLNMIDLDSNEYYIEASEMMELILVFVYFEQRNFDTNTNWNGTNYSLNDLKWIKNIFVTNSLRNILINDPDFYNDIIENPESLIQNLIENFEYLVDVVFNEYYINSKQEIKISNIKPIYQTTQSGERKTESLMMFDDIDDIEKVFNLNNMSENLQTYEYNDGVPVLISSYFYEKLKSEKLISNNDTFTIKINNFLINDSPSNYDIEFKMKIVGVYDVYIDLGIITIYDYVIDTIERIIPGQEIEINFNRIFTLESDITQESVSIIVDSPESLLNGNSSLMFSPYFGRDDWTEQAMTIYEIVQSSLYIISIFALFVGVVLILLAIKEIIDSSRREVSMLKAFGYRNFKSTSLVLIPYIFMIMIGLVFSIPLSMILLSSLASLLTSLTGSTFKFRLSTIQWLVILIFVVLLISFILLISYYSFKKTKAIDAIRESDE